MFIQKLVGFDRRGGTCIEFELAEGTQIPFGCSFGPSLSFNKIGTSAFVALAYWDQPFQGSAIKSKDTNE